MDWLDWYIIGLIGLVQIFPDSDVSMEVIMLYRKHWTRRLSNHFSQCKDRHVVGLIIWLLMSIYGYNVNSRISYSDAKLLCKKDTNVNEIIGFEKDDLQESMASLPRRNNVRNIFVSNMWSRHIWLIDFLKGTVQPFECWVLRCISALLIEKTNQENQLSIIQDQQTWFFLNNLK
jgi:hypothetical protein